MKKFFKDPWTIGIGTSVLAVIFLRFIDWLTGNATWLSRPFDWLQTMMIGAFDFITSSHEVPFYVFAIILISGSLPGALVVAVPVAKSYQVTLFSTKDKKLLAYTRIRSMA